MRLWGAVVAAARRLVKPRRDRRRSRSSDFGFPVSGGDLQTRDLMGPSVAFESGVLRVMRSAVVEPERRPRLLEALDDARPEGTVAVLHPCPDSTVIAHRPHGLRVEDDEPTAELPDFDEFHHAAISCNDTLPQDVLRYFDAVGILPITGVNDPSLREKLANPSTYGWDRRVHQTSMHSGAVNPSLPSMRVWRLVPAYGSSARVGQNVILSESGDVFVETAGPWGTTWMHRAPNGAVTSREHRIAPVRSPSLRPRLSMQRSHAVGGAAAAQKIAI